jgi:hypothetical protein
MFDLLPLDYGSLRTPPAEPPGDLKVRPCHQVPATSVGGQPLNIALYILIYIYILVYLSYI